MPEPLRDPDGAERLVCARSGTSRSHEKNEVWPLGRRGRLGGHYAWNEPVTERRATVFLRDGSLESQVHRDRELEGGRRGWGEGDGG